MKAPDMLETVPTWVTPSPLLIASVGNITFAMWLHTMAPWLRGAWLTVAWLDAGKGHETPITERRTFPGIHAAAAEMKLAIALYNADPYPQDPARWVDYGYSPGDAMPRQVWEDWTGTGYLADRAGGAAAAYAWLFGACDNPSALAPDRYGDGRRVEAPQRELMRRALLDPPRGRKAEEALLAELPRHYLPGREPAVEDRAAG